MKKLPLTAMQIAALEQTLKAEIRLHEGVAIRLARRKQTEEKHSPRSTTLRSILYSMLEAGMIKDEDPWTPELRERFEASLKRWP